MKEKTVVSFILAMLLLVAVLPPDASGIVEPTGHEEFNFQTPTGTLTQQDHSTSSEPPPTEWNKTYGGTDKDWAFSVVETSDGGYALTGETASYGAGYNDMWLVRTNSSGNVQWNRTYGGDKPDKAWSAVETSDGGYALAGYTNSYAAGKADFWLVKTDPAGNALWNKTYGGKDIDWAYSVVQTDDGGYALAGITNSFSADDYDLWLVKTDSDGSMQWNQTYGGNNNEAAYSVVQTGDSGYAIAGYTYSSAHSSNDFWLVKTDSTGNMEWNKTYGGDESDKAHSLVQTDDGGYAIAGDTKSYGAGPFDFWLVKTDSAGNALWNKTYGGANHDIAYSVVQTDDGGYAIAGYTASYGASSDEFWLVKVEAEVHDVAITDVAPSKTVVGQNFTLSINVTVANQGNYPETFNVTIYANTTVIEIKTVTLESEDSTTITFTWNTTGFTYGNYTISTTASTVPGEIDTDDNIFIDDTVFVTIPGDVDGDGDVDPHDFALLAGAYGTKEGDSSYNPHCDLDGDGDVDPDDFAIFAGNYGKTI